MHFVAGFNFAEAMLQFCKYQIFFNEFIAVYGEVYNLRPYVLICVVAIRLLIGFKVEKIADGQLLGCNLN